MTESVTVAIPTRGDRPGIASTIRSVMASAQGRPFELLIVWSGLASPPPWATSLPGDPRHVPARPLGLSVARNAGLRFASGDLILMPDDDVVCASSWFEAAVAALIDGADIVGGPVTCRWPNGRPLWMSADMESVFGSFCLGPDARDLVDRQGLTGGNMGMWRKPILALGGYDVSLGVRGRRGGMGEENDLCDRALNLGLRVTYVPDARVDQMMEPRAATRRTYLRRMYRFGRSMAIVRSEDVQKPTKLTAAAAKRLLGAPFTRERMEQIGSACFELGEVRSRFWPY